MNLKSRLSPKISLIMNYNAFAKFCIFYVFVYFVLFLSLFWLFVILEKAILKVDLVGLYIKRNVFTTKTKRGVNTVVSAFVSQLSGVRRHERVREPEGFSLDMKHHGSGDSSIKDGRGVCTFTDAHVFQGSKQHGRGCCHGYISVMWRLD